MVSDKTVLKLLKIYQDILEQESTTITIADSVHANYRHSVMNLYRYLIVRSNELRGLHNDLTEHGLSGLRTSEGYIYDNLTHIIRLIKLMKGKVWSPIPGIKSIGFKKSQKLLKKHTNRLFGKVQNKRKTRIMVTIPTQASCDSEFVKNLITNGMEIARINMSHDDVNVWRKMIEQIKSQSEITKKKVKIFMDISGPKIRTGNILPFGKKKKKAYINLQQGDHLIIHSEGTPATQPIYNKSGELVRPASISITDRRIFKKLKLQDRISFDDGKIESKVINLTKDKAELMITNAESGPEKLKSEKGVNLPDTKLSLPSLTNKDIQDLSFAANHADILGYSFVRTPEDIKELYEVLQMYENSPGIVLKIENETAFHNLPLLLMEGMKFPNIGVMIARGDLMVEIGPERIAEVQDQILWICEAAHVPVIWATQVFESLAKKGRASRAEITDAAKSTRAECVMLNKGAFIQSAVTKLSDIITRMEKHTSKKKSKMRALHVAVDTIKHFKKKKIK